MLNLVPLQFPCHERNSDGERVRVLKESRAEEAGQQRPERQARLQIHTANTPRIPPMPALSKHLCPWEPGPCSMCLNNKNAHINNMSRNKISNARYLNQSTTQKNNFSPSRSEGKEVTGEPVHGRWGQAQVPDETWASLGDST